MAEVSVHVTSNFSRAFRRLPPRIRNLATRKDQLFRADPWQRRLKSHKLKGQLYGFWSYSVNYEYRILFRFVNDHEVLYYDVGTHGIYR